ncbi:MAG: polysaccharide lyase family 1 protein [Pleurocapsa sp.]
MINDKKLIKDRLDKKFSFRSSDFVFKRIFCFCCCFLCLFPQFFPQEFPSSSCSQTEENLTLAESLRFLPAFPEAEGFGAMSVGGRGGKIIEVTNLNDRGSGSLRAAIKVNEPRTVIFKVGGTIQLDSSLEITDPYITIAGQTAPGGGITLKNSSKNTEAPLKIKTHDVIVRYIRARPGSNPNENGNLDALTIAGKSGKVYNVIVDHSSFSWATDEVVSTYNDLHNITIQWSIIAEGLDCSTHVENGEQQCHSMGLLISSEGQKDISIHHNLLAHNRRRNPLVKVSGVVDVVNNVVYNSGFGENSFAPTHVRGDNGLSQVNYINNYFKPGVNTGSSDWFIDTKYEPVEIYIEGNVVPKRVMHPKSLKWVVANPHSAAKIIPSSAPVAYQQVLEYAGANQRLRDDGTFLINRDSIDQRIVQDVQQTTGSIIDEPSQVGGWSKINSGDPYKDTDHDGMPDKYEKLYGFNPRNASDGSEDANGDGYTNIEEFLNGSCPL